MNIKIKNNMYWIGKIDWEILNLNFYYLARQLSIKELW